MKLNKLLLSVLALGVTVATLAPAMAADPVVEPNKGESWAEFQSLNFPYIDRREIRVSEGTSGIIDMTHLAYLEDHDRFALNMLNDTDKPVNILIPELEINFLVPANTDRVYEFNTEAVGVHREVPYTIEVIDVQTRYMAQDERLMDIINSKIDVQSYQNNDPEPTYYNSKPSRGSNVRGYW